jgi:hypothetical protein
MNVTLTWTEAEAKANGVEYVYSKGLDKYMPLDELGDLCDEDLDALGKVFACDEVQISFDAESVIDNACSDLHEDAYDQIPAEAFEEMQAFFDKWAEKYGKPTTSYSPDYKRLIVVDVYKHKEDNTHAG